MGDIGDPGPKGQKGEPGDKGYENRKLFFFYLNNNQYRIVIPQNQNNKINHIFDILINNKSKYKIYFLLNHLYYIFIQIAVTLNF